MAMTDMQAQAAAYLLLVVLVLGYLAQLGKGWQVQIAAFALVIALPLMVGLVALACRTPDVIIVGAGAVTLIVACILFDKEQLEI